MAKFKDLTPKLKSRLKTAEHEFQVQYQAGELPFGQNIGGAQMYSNVFKRGYGDAVFGSSEDGIWLGAADFGDAPFSVDMNGNLIATSGVFGDVLTKSDADQALSGSIIISGYLMVKISGTPIIVIGTVS